MSSQLIEVSGLTKRFGAMLALNDVSFELRAGEVLGLVGESGSGKSTAIRCMVGLEKPSGGRIAYDGVDLSAATREQMRRYRRDVQMIFQDPYSSLDPRMTVMQILEEPMLVAGGYTAAARRERVLYLIHRLGLHQEHLSRYPRHFSGGQRQRIAIIRALTVEPRVLLCDEPVSALDVSVQAQVLNLLKDMQKELGLTILFVAHDLAVVKYLCTRIVVLRRGVVEETGDVAQVYSAPKAAYTRELLDAVAVPDPQVERERRAARLTRLAAAR
ncbi:MAG: ABC transporter ATP-binding protein [Rhizobiaceae bacterium]|nr:ABC transporter ATP-binding protein [Rhizobiaceae bacterium]